MEGALTGTFLVSGTASLVLAVFSLFLPHTPPSSREGEPFAPFEAIKLLAIPSILVLFIVTFFDSLVHYGYYFWTSRYFQSIGVPENWIAPAMSIGQTMEVVAMALLGVPDQEARLAEDVDLRGPQPGGPVRRLRDRRPRPALAGDRRQRGARVRLRLLLRDGLHLRRRALPEGRPRERPEPVQPA